MKLTSKERSALYRKFDSRVVRGLTKLPSKGKALSHICGLMDAAGYSLDMVTGDILMGDKGNRLLPFRRLNPEGADAFSEQPLIENCYVSFTWENLSHRGDPASYEIVAYLT